MTCARRRGSVLLSLAVGFSSLLVGCSSAAPTVLPFVAEPTASPTQTPASPTDLATEPGLAPTPGATDTAAPTLEPTVAPTAEPTPAPTAKPATFYKPPGWDGHSDVNCPDFDTHAHALSFFKGTGGTTSNDPYGLDRDHDGSPCESLP